MFRKTEHAGAMTTTPTTSKSTPGGRILEVLETFTYGSPKQTLDQAQIASSLPRSTTYRALKILMAHGWLTHSKGGYSLGEKATTFVQGFNHEMLRSAASSALNELQLASGAVAHLSVLEGPFVCHIDKIGGRAWKEIPSRIGTRLPAVSTAAGQAILASLSPEAARDVLQMHTDEGLPPYDEVALHAEFLTSKRYGGVLVRDGKRHRSGISTAAASILLNDAPVAAISLAWKGDRTSLARAAQLVRVTTDTVSTELVELMSF